MKARFLIKIMMLRYQGKTLDLSKRIENWIENNLDRLFDNPQVRENLLKIKYSNPDRQARIEDYLMAHDKDVELQKILFQQALREFALDELMYKKFRYLTYKKKMRFSNSLHPMNDYQYRSDFINRNIEQFIAYFNYGEKRIIEGQVDINQLHEKIKQN